MLKSIMLLGSGELGKEFAIAVKRYGHRVIAVDSYANAPAMQLSDLFEVISMLNGDELDAIVNKHQPDIIVPEIEAIRTGKFYEYEKRGIQVVPSAKAANFTMNRKAIRDLAAKELGIRTANYAYATSFETLKKATETTGFPCVVKPLMSSSGKGQSTLKSIVDAEKAWKYAIDSSRGDITEVIVESFINFEFEITLLTVTQKNGKVLFCPPIGHRQERGDYQESWQPCPVKAEHLEQAKYIAEKITKALGGAGLWGIEFFIAPEGVFFSELSPRPHDTGMVTLAGTQNFNEFELHARAVLGIPIPEISLENSGASAVILANEYGKDPEYSGIEVLAALPNTDFRIFGKQDTRPYRRMGVALYKDKPDADIKKVIDKAVDAASKVKVNSTLLS